MPDLIVMRHAKSDWGTGLADFDRPLSERGHDNAPRMASWLDEEGYVPDAAITSSAVRARTTARYVVEHFAMGNDRVDERSDLYLADANTWLDMLHSMTETYDCLLICGHNPGIDDLVEYLAGETPDLTPDGKLMTTAAVAVFTVDDWSTLSPASCRLVQIMRPKDLPG